MVVFGITEASIVLEEVAASGAAMNGCSALHTSMFGMNPVVKHGSDDLPPRYLPEVVEGRLHVRVRRDRARRRHRHHTHLDPGDAATVTAYLVRGRKVWMTKAPYCQKVLLLVRTTPVQEVARKTDGLSLLLADLQGTAGRPSRPSRRPDATRW